MTREELITELRELAGIPDPACAIEKAKVALQLCESLTEERGLKLQIRAALAGLESGK